EIGERKFALPGVCREFAVNLEFVASTILTISYCRGGILPFITSRKSLNLPVRISNGVSVGHLRNQLIKLNKYHVSTKRKPEVGSLDCEKGAVVGAKNACAAKLLRFGLITRCFSEFQVVRDCYEILIHDKWTDFNTVDVSAFDEYLPVIHAGRNQKRNKY